MTLRRRELIGAAAALPLAASLPPAHAQQAASGFPHQPIRIVFPSSPGGLLDITSRLVGEELTAAWSQPAVVDSRPGANGLVAAKAVSSSRADGYTMLITNSGVIQSSLVQPSNQFQLSELTPVFLLGLVYAGLGVNVAVPANNMSELIQLIKSQPGKFSFGTTGLGSAGHLTGLMLNKLAGLDMTHVAYKGEPPALQDLISGQIPVAIVTPAGMDRASATGKVRVLGVNGPKRLTAMPNVPTFSEFGFDERVQLVGWIGVFAPSATPADVVQKISQQLTAAMGRGPMRQRLLDLGCEPMPLEANAFAGFVNKDVDVWRSAIRDTGYQHGAS